MKERGPIFYDAERVRWRRTRRVMEITGVLLTLFARLFFRVPSPFSVELPAGLLPDTKPGYRAVKSKRNQLLAKAAAVAWRTSGMSRQATTRAGCIFVSWDPNSLASLKKHYKDIDLLIPEQLHAVSADGALTIVDYERGQYTTKPRPPKPSRY